MSHISTIILAATFVSLFTHLKADDEPTKIPYDVVNKQMALMKSKDIEGRKCVAYFMKSNLEDMPINSEKAEFRIITKAGKPAPLKITELKDIAVEDRNDMEKNAFEEGFTHIMWIPKGLKEYEGGYLVHSLPKGSVQVMAGIMIKGSIPLK